MQKTKLGVTVALLGAALYFSGLFSGYIITIVLAGYVLLMEENLWLKKAAVKSVALMMVFSILSAVLGLVPGMVNFIDDVFNIFNGSFSIRFVTNIITMLRSGLNLIETVLFLLLGLKALNQGTIPVPGVDKLVDKCFETKA